MYALGIIGLYLVWPSLTLIHILMHAKLFSGICASNTKLLMTPYFIHHRFYLPFMECDDGFGSICEKERRRIIVEPIRNKSMTVILISIHLKLKVVIV
jgi:hypothetical protein